MRVNPDQGLQFAQMLVQDEEPLANINQVNTHKRERLSHWRHPARVLPKMHVPVYPYTCTQTHKVPSVGAYICVIPDVAAMPGIH